MSGIQPTGEIHIGNYFGAVENWIRISAEYESFISIVDYHALTVPYDPAEFPRRVEDAAVSLLAAGLDPDRIHLFVQSDVPEHTELAWLFNAVTPVGDLERMTQYKDKSAALESVPAGLLNYPVLQAADILLYHATHVPVGEDQLQHLELTREIARKWNARYGNGEAFFPEPRPVLSEAGRIVGLDGEAKMSKSLGNTVGILAEPNEIRERIATAVTDPQRVRLSDPGRPEVCNVYTLHTHFTDEERLPDIAHQCRTAQRGCVACKGILAESIVEHFRPMRERAAHYREHPDEVRAILDEGAERARIRARATLREVRERMGLDWRRAVRPAAASPSG